MPNPNDNFLRGWCRQLRSALDEGGELGYEAAELIDEALELLGPDESEQRPSVDGAPDGEMEFTDGGSGEAAGANAPGPAGGRQQAHHPGVPGVGSHVEYLPTVHDSSAGVPRGTGSGHPSTVVVDGQVRTVSQKRLVSRGSRS